jgi:hypothetical protein
MSFGGGAPGFQAIEALVAAHGTLTGVSDKDWATAAGIIVKKLLISAGQDTASLAALRKSVGDDIFEVQLKSLTHHQARQLARRLDKAVPDLEVSTAAAAIAHVRTLLAPAPVAEPEASPADPATDEPETTQEEKQVSVPAQEPESETVTDEPPPSPPVNPYFGRKSFRTG